MSVRSFCLLAAVLLLTASVRADADGDKKPAPRAVKVTVDTSEVPEVAEWAGKAKALVEKWHPIVAELLPSDGFTPPREIRIVFRKNMKGVAYTSRATIVIAADWIKKHPDDYGMVVHELTHAIQAYPGGRPGWLVEGIADYIRFFHYEPKTRIDINPRRSGYRDGYRTTAAFLAWIEKEHDKDIIRKLNESLRQPTFNEQLFKMRTGKTVDELWAEFIAAREKK
jgi:hypothetical protein